MGFITGAGGTNIDLLYSGMERIPDVGEELYSEDFSLQLGGGLPATLINLSRLNIKTKIATQLGQDMFSDFAKSEFKKAGADIVNLYSGNKIPLTITSAVILPEDRTFFSFTGYTEPDDRMKEEFYQMSKGADITLMERSGYLDVYKKLHEEGTLLILDTGWDDNMSLEAYSDYLEIADFYTPNQKEAMKITAKNTPEEAAYTLKKYFDKVVIKLDKDGCLGLDDEIFYVRSIDEFNHVDSTGAGDAFLAGFAYGLYHRYPFKDSILFGNITGGKAVTKAGALSAHLTEKELLEFYEKYK